MTKKPYIFTENSRQQVCWTLVNFLHADNPNITEYADKILHILEDELNRGIIPEL